MTSRLPRITLADQVRDFIVMEIARGALAPGASVRELEIAQRLGTSQTPVREAFRKLAAVGLLETRIHVGTRVRDFTAKDLSDAVPVRAALEGMAGRIVAELGIREDAELEAALAHMEAVAATGERLALAGASTAFHRRIITMAGNDSLRRAWESLGIEVMTVMALAHTTIDSPAVAHSHRPVLEALLSGDPDRAERELTEHQFAYIPSSMPADEGKNAS
ncbi:GntR family transcriptional regulator [Kibdelosporangium philippinense]|uniref:GntR family transcriptional regulator n=1 Tax=Kibdelosporangium philippinense TaxID=211113 RepID=A0ABS8Z921_9PSEU|nr:GntR family transcriptional regulator [Kibdelosporangium philippinense]MCE7002352.1 GntR family transcriptional regulator [Kibdelosporangium philippinense]